METVKQNSCLFPHFYEKPFKPVEHCGKSSFLQKPSEKKLWFSPMSGSCSTSTKLLTFQVQGIPQRQHLKHAFEKLLPSAAELHSKQSKSLPLPAHESCCNHCCGLSAHTTNAGNFHTWRASGQCSRETAIPPSQFVRLSLKAHQCFRSCSFVAVTTQIAREVLTSDIQC